MPWCARQLASSIEPKPEHRMRSKPGGATGAGAGAGQSVGITWPLRERHRLGDNAPSMRLSARVGVSYYFEGMAYCMYTQY